MDVRKKQTIFKVMLSVILLIILIVFLKNLYLEKKYVASKDELKSMYMAQKGDNIDNFSDEYKKVKKHLILIGKKYNEKFGFAHAPNEMGVVDLFPLEKEKSHLIFRMEKPFDSNIINDNMFFDDYPKIKRTSSMKNKATEEFKKLIPYSNFLVQTNASETAESMKEADKMSNYLFNTYILINVKDEKDVPNEAELKSIVDKIKKIAPESNIRIWCVKEDDFSYIKGVDTIERIYDTRDEVRLFNKLCW